MVKDRTYSSKEVAKLVDIEPVTVRKYAQKLEEKGYIFKKDQKGWRCFTDDDLGALTHLVTLRQNGMSLDESIDHIASLYHHKLSVLPSDITLQDDILKEFIKTQVEFNQKVIERLDRQEQRQAERDEKLMIALNQSIETQKQLASTQQKKWWKFWRK